MLTVLFEIFVVLCYPSDMCGFSTNLALFYFLMVFCVWIWYDVRGIKIKMWKCSADQELHLEMDQGLMARRPQQAEEGWIIKSSENITCTTYSSKIKSKIELPCEIFARISASTDPMWCITHKLIQRINNIQIVKELLGPFLFCKRRLL